MPEVDIPKGRRVPPGSASWPAGRPDAAYVLPFMTFLLLLLLNDRLPYSWRPSPFVRGAAIIAVFLLLRRYCRRGPGTLGALRLSSAW